MVPLEPGADAVPGLADDVRDGPAELNLGRGIRLVAALVLEALDLQPVARSVRQPAGDDEARYAGPGLRQGEKHVGVRHGKEPLVADDRPSAVAIVARSRLRLAQIRSSLLLG